MKRILSEHERKVKERNEAVTKRYLTLMSVEGQAATPVINKIMEEFGIKSTPTVYKILKAAGLTFKNCRA